MSCRAFVVSLLLLCVWSVVGPVFLEANATKGVLVLPCSALRERGGGGYTNSPGMDDMRRAEDGEAGGAQTVREYVACAAPPRHTSDAAILNTQQALP